LIGLLTLRLAILILVLVCHLALSSCARPNPLEGK
jgi:hypothetical protein